MMDAGTMRAITRDLIVQASTTYRPDQIAAYRLALARTDEGPGRWVLEQLLANADVAGRKQSPLCDDTGIPHLFLELSTESDLGPLPLQAMAEGVRDGLRALPGRAMAVHGNPQQRVEQSAGLGDDPAEVIPPALVLEPAPGPESRLTVLMLGGGPEIRSRTYRVFHERSLKRVLAEAANWAVEGTRLLGCTPSVLAIGIGRTHYEATTLMGLGGGPTVLGTFIRIGAQRASGARIVCLRPGCCMDPRRATRVLG
jgi:fumarate hydratase subunit alpha